MEIKRVFKKDQAGELVIEHGEPVLDYIKVKRLSANQKITQKTIDNGLGLGFLSITKGKIIFHAQDRDYQFKIIRQPGYYCCHDGKRLASQKEARAYVSENFAGVESPDKLNLSGYRDDRFYDCELEEGL